MQDLTFIIPFQKDSEDRLENLLFVINYLKANTDASILISTTTPNIQYIPGDVDCCYKPDPGYNIRTELGQLGYRKAKTKYVCLNDVDVIIEPEHYKYAYEFLKEHDIVYPYYTPMFEVERDFIVNKEFKKDNVKYPCNVGGLFWGNKDKIMSAGGENCTMKGWGFEDYERYERFRRLLLNIKNISIPVYHIKHEITIFNNINNPDADKNLLIYNRVMSMKHHELLEYAMLLQAL